MQNFDIKITIKDFQRICRVCLIAKEDLESIYSILIGKNLKQEAIDLVKIFFKYCDVKINPADEKPQSVCKSCIQVFCDSYAFFDRCSRSDQILDNILIENEKVCNVIATKEIYHTTSPTNTNKTTCRKANKGTLHYSSESDDDIYGKECDDDSDWEPSKEKWDQLVKQEQDEHFNDYVFSGRDLEIKLERPTRRSNRRSQILRINEPLKKRGVRKKTAPEKTIIDESDVIESQNMELLCRLCNEILLDINTSIDHYDEVHAPQMEIDECIFCDKPKYYKKRENLLYHLSLHSKDSIKCIPCKKYFRNKEALDDHLNECFKMDNKTFVKLEESLTDSNILRKGNSTTNCNSQLSQKVLKNTQYDGAFTCQICHEKLGEIDSVVSHFKKEHLNDLVCIICLRSFTKQVPLFHLGLHSKKALVCRSCRMLFTSKEEYDTHNSKYDHDKSLSCKICGKKFSRNYKKNKHMLSHLKEKNYSCNKCGKTFTYKTSLVRHFKMHFGKRFLCSSCGNAYTTKFMLQRHIRIMHTHVDEDGNPLPKPAPKPVKLQCEFCGEIFSTKYGYGRHIRRHPEFKEFKCKICSFMCDNKGHLEVHMENKHNKHTCDVCGKRFPFESELKTHHRKHEDIAMARFRCDVCGKTARTQTQLKVHYRIHTGERPFSCEICGKSFKQTAHLKVHMFQHTGKMPFKCKICDKSFPFQHVMEIHIRTHTGEKPFQCVCGNAYHDRTTLQKHQKKKHPEIPVEKSSRGEYKISALS